MKPFELNDRLHRPYKNSDNYKEQQEPSEYVDITPEVLLGFANKKREDFLLYLDYYKADKYFEDQSE